MGWLSKYFGSTDITVNETTGAIRTQDDSLSTIVETLIDDGRLKVDASGITLNADIIDVDMEAITGTPSKTLADVVAALQLLIPPDTSTSLPASTMICGTKIIADADVAEPLVADSTSCKGVWIGAPVTIATGAAVNTKGVLVGNDTTQNFPIMPSNFEGKTFLVSDASNLYIKAGEDGESINYIIYQ